MEMFVHWMYNEKKKKANKSVVLRGKIMERNVKCPKCGFAKTVHVSVLQWRCPNCKHWIKVDKIDRPIKQ